MSREEMKEIIRRVANKVAAETAADAPTAGCIFSDNPSPCDQCDMTTAYSVGEET